MSSGPSTNSQSSRPSAAVRAWRLVGRLGLLSLKLAALALLLALCFLRWPSKRHQWDQPANVNYQSYDPYSVVIYEVSPLLAAYPRYEVFVVNSPSLSYGHVVEYGFHNAAHELDYFSRCIVDWSPDGITVTEPTGHKLFIPKKAFIGGR
jgi:hypothetical protein